MIFVRVNKCGDMKGDFLNFLFKYVLQINKQGVFILIDKVYIKSYISFLGMKCCYNYLNSMVK